MKVVLDELVSKVEHIKNGKMLYQITNSHYSSWGSLSVEVARLPSMLKLIKKIDHVAVLTDTPCIKKASAIEDTLISSLKIQPFNLNQRDEVIKRLSTLLILSESCCVLYKKFI